MNIQPLLAASFGEALLYFGIGLVVIIFVGGIFALLTCYRKVAQGQALVKTGMGGAKVELNLGVVLGRRLTLIGSTLRARPVEEKAAIVRGFIARFGEDLATGRIRAVVDRVLPLAKAGDAHRALKASEHFGKIVLTP